MWKVNWVLMDFSLTTGMNESHLMLDSINGVNGSNFKMKETLIEREKREEGKIFSYYIFRSHSRIIY